MKEVVIGINTLNLPELRVHVEPLPPRAQKYVEMIVDSPPLKPASASTIDRDLDVTKLPELESSFRCDPVYAVERASDSCRAFMRYNFKCMCAMVAVLIVGIAATLLVLASSGGGPSSPCLTYGSTTPASSVSIACLNNLWTQFCSTKAPGTFSSSYQGFWNQNPAGSTLVMCVGGAWRSPQCGIGTYGNLVVNMQFCYAGSVW